MAGWKSIQNQINIIRSKGMDVSPLTITESILERKNYYTLINAYKELFIIPGSNPTAYISGISIKEVYSIYNFDFNLRILYLKNILKIEAELRTHIAYEFGKRYGSNGWQNRASYDSNNQYVTDLINKLNEVVNKGIIKNKDMITHFTNNGRVVPIWVLIECIELGTLRSFYNCLTQSLREVIARSYYNLSELELRNFIAYLNDIRNVCAHDNRLLFFKNRTNINDFTIHSNLNIPRNSSGFYKYGKRDCFALLIAMKYLLDEKEFKDSYYQINSLFVKLKRNLNVIKMKDIMKSLGYPTISDSKGWKYIISTSK